MIDLFFDEDHDLALDGADLKFADEDDIVKQRLTIRLQFLLAEWFLDNTVGVPYTQTIFAVGTTLSDIYDIIRKKIIETDGVNSLETLELTPNADGRSLRIDFEVISNTGNTTSTVNIQV